MTVNLGIDIGGTKTNVGLVDANGTVLMSRKLPTRKDDVSGLVAEVKTTAAALLAEKGMTLSDLAFLGAGVPGTADRETGVVAYCPNLEWYDLPMGEAFQRAFGRRVVVAQDSRNGALAEKLFGAGRDYTDLICITIGTGIGCGIILGGKVFNGSLNTAGEVGHTPIVKDGLPCLCGKRGCLERYVSGSGIFERAYAAHPELFQGKELKCETVFDLAYAGNRDMLALIDESMDYLAMAIANQVSLLSPQAVLVSGGLCVHEDLVVKPLEEKITKYGYYSWTRLKKLVVRKALLGSDAPMIGASALDRG